MSQEQCENCEIITEGVRAIAKNFFTRGCRLLTTLAGVPMLDLWVVPQSLKYQKFVRCYSKRNELIHFYNTACILLRLTINSNQQHFILLWVSSVKLVQWATTTLNYQEATEGVHANPQGAVAKMNWEGQENNWVGRVEPSNPPPPTMLTMRKARFPLPEFTGRVHFLTPVNSGRQLGCQKMHPSSRAVNSARELGLWTRVVETGLKRQVNQAYGFLVLVVSVSCLVLNIWFVNVSTIAMWSAGNARAEMTDYVSSGTLNSTQSLTQLDKDHYRI